MWIEGKHVNTISGVWQCYGQHTKCVCEGLAISSELWNSAVVSVVSEDLA